MDISRMKACLLDAARECDDLVGDPQPTLKLSKKAVDLTSSGNPVVDLPLQGGKGGKGGGKGGKGQHAHPQPKGTGTTSDAGGVVQTREDRGRSIRNCVLTSSMGVVGRVMHAPVAC